MADFNLSNLISAFVNRRPTGVNTSASARSAQPSMPTPTPQNTTPAPSAGTNYANPQMAGLEGSERAAYVKDMMNMPKNMNELVFMMQKGMSYQQFQQQFAQINANRNALSQTQAQILAQLQGLSLTEAQNMLLTGSKSLPANLQSTLRNLTLSSNGLINLTDISALIQANGKDAIAKIITSMAAAARQGVGDLSQLRDAAKIINASIATAAQNDSAQTLKMLMLLYLPWLPLQEGTGFDLEIQAGEKDDLSDSILIITITTLNYGTITAVLMLEDMHSVSVSIQCSEKFPKDELLLRIQADEKHYSMQSVVAFETKETATPAATDKPQAKVNMSETNMINPYMLLMAHTIIRHVMEIDKQG